MKIEIQSTDEGFMYDIWTDETVDEDTPSNDGGLCTGSLLDALEMATEQAKELIIKLKIK